WSALRLVLSPAAVEQIKNHGTFYSLLSENPNAVEWGIFWLRIFQLGLVDFPDAADQPPWATKSLATIPAGVRAVTTELVRDLEARGTVSLLRDREVTGIRPTKDGRGTVDFVDRRGL